MKLKFNSWKRSIKHKLLVRLILKKKTQITYIKDKRRAITTDYSEINKFN